MSQKKLLRLLFSDTLKERQDARTGKPIKDLLAPLVIEDEPRMFQNGKVPAHGGKLDADRFDKLTDTMLLAVRKLLDDPEPRRMAERLENFRFMATAVFIESQHGSSFHLAI